MLNVDSALLDLTEWLCRRFQVLTGRTNVWLAFQLTNFSIVVFFVWAGMHFRIGGQPFRIALAAFCGGLLYLLTRTLFKVPVETYENNAYRRVSRGLRNPRRVRDALLRIAFLTFSLMLFFPGTVRLSVSAGARHSQSGSEQLRRCARTHGADDGHAVSGGVRPTSAVPGEGARVVALARFRATGSRCRTGRPPTPAGGLELRILNWRGTGTASQPQARRPGARDHRNLTQCSPADQD